MPSVQDALSIDSSSVMSSEISRRHNEDIKALVANIHNYRAKHWIDNERSKKYLRIIDAIANGQGKPSEYGEKIFKMKKRLEKLKKEHKMKGKERHSDEADDCGDRFDIGENRTESLEAEREKSIQENGEAAATFIDANHTEESERGQVRPSFQKMKPDPSVGKKGLSVHQLKLEDDEKKSNIASSTVSDIIFRPKIDLEEVEDGHEQSENRDIKDHHQSVQQLNLFFEDSNTTNATATARCEGMNHPKDLHGVLSHEDIQNLFVEMCTFARMGFLQPPSCLHCAYRNCKGNQACDNLVVWRQNAGVGHNLHPEKIQGNVLFVTCSTAQAWIRGEDSHHRKWNSEQKILLKT